MKSEDIIVHLLKDWRFNRFTLQKILGLYLLDWIFPILEYDIIR